jgi:ribosome recycling factor
MSSYKFLPADKIIEHLKKRLVSIRTGRVNATVLDNILVAAYGDKMPIQSIATVNVPESGQLLITPFDKSLNQAIEKAIFDANIGASPINDGAGIRLMFPPLTEEARMKRAKDVNVHEEETKITVRSERQDILKQLKVSKDAGEISEDELKRQEVAIQKEVDMLNKEIEALCQDKKSDLMKI